MKTTVSILGVEIPLATLDRVTWKTPSEFDAAASLLFDGDLIESLKSESDLFTKIAEYRDTRIPVKPGRNYQFFQYADLAVKP